MPAYFFDFSEDGRVSVDDVGSELANDEAAQREAVEALTGVARSFPPLGQRLIGIVVRDVAGREIYESSITFDGKDLDRVTLTDCS